MLRIWFGIFPERIAEKECVKAAVVIASPEDIRGRRERPIEYRGPVKNNSLRVDAQRLKIALDEQRPALSGLIRLRHHQGNSEYSGRRCISMDPYGTGRGKGKPEEQEC